MEDFFFFLKKAKAAQNWEAVTVEKKRKRKEKVCADGWCSVNFCESKKPFVLYCESSESKKPIYFL